MGFCTSKKPVLTILRTVKAITVIDGPTASFSAHHFVPVETQQSCGAFLAWHCCDGCCQCQTDHDDNALHHPWQKASGNRSHNHNGTFIAVSGIFLSCFKASNLIVLFDTFLVIPKEYYSKGLWWSSQRRHWHHNAKIATFVCGTHQYSVFVWEWQQAMVPSGNESIVPLFFESRG